MLKKTPKNNKILFRNDELQLVYTGVDAITITNGVEPQDGDKVNARLVSHARIGEIAHTFRYELFPEEEVKAFWANSSSWQCGSMVYKPSKTVTKLEIKGDVCNEAFALLMTWLDDEFKFTRLDLCCDYLLKKRRAIVPYVHNYLEHEAQGKATMILSPTGDTLTIGSRQSAVYGRIYDKSKRYQLPLESAYRFELEYKKLQPQAIVRAMRKNNDLEHFIRWSIQRQLKLWGCQLPSEIARPEHLPELEARLTTNDMRIAFLKRQVRGVVGKLLVAGREQETLDALGLHRYSKDSTLTKPVQ